MEQMSSRRILIIDDNVGLAENIAEILAMEGHVTDVAASAEEALSKVVPGLSRATTLRKCAPRCAVVGGSVGSELSASRAKVRHNFAGSFWIGNAKPAGITPTTV